MHSKMTDLSKYGYCMCTEKGSREDRDFTSTINIQNQVLSGMSVKMVTKRYPIEESFESANDRVLNKELYSHRIQTFLLLNLFTELFCKDFPSLVRIDYSYFGRKDKLTSEFCIYIKIYTFCVFQNNP